MENDLADVSACSNEADSKIWSGNEHAEGEVQFV